MQDKYPEALARERFRKTCKWSRSFLFFEPRCAQPDIVRVHSSTNPVTGWTAVRRPECREIRFDNHHSSRCGYAGNLWEAR